MRFCLVCAIGTVVAIASGAWGQDAVAFDRAALLDNAGSSVVIVEHTFRYDRGEAPEVDFAGLPYRGAESDLEADWAGLIAQERPSQRLGFVVGPDRVITVDPLVHGRFVERIEIIDGNRRIGATPEAYAIAQNALMLRLDEPVRHAAPTTFVDPDEQADLHVIHGRSGNGRWWLSTGPVETSLVSAIGGPTYQSVPWPSLIVTDSGNAIAASFNGALPIDGSWRGAPSAWQWMRAADLDALEERIDEIAGNGLPRVELRFRSPRQDSMDRWNPNEDQLTEWNGTGVVLDEHRVLVLAGLDPKVTARLDQVTVHTPDGPVQAEFIGTLRDYNAMLVETPGSLIPAPLASDTLHDVEDSMLVRAEIRLLGESRTTYVWPARIARMIVGARGHLLGATGTLSPSDFVVGDGSESPLTFMFSTQGELVALPLIARSAVANTQDWRGRSRADFEATVLGASDIAPILGAPDALDPDNRPLSEEEENRLAWLGVELQAMDPDLARFNNVADLTSGGLTGGIVTYVYDGSPAMLAGIRLGDILLRLHIDGQPRPLEVEVSQFDMGWGAQFLEILEQLDPSYYDRVPPPWGSVETALTRALTDVGFGTPYIADVFRNGETLEVAFEVEEGPAHFGAAPRFKSDALGITVRDVTYEARRFLQRPGSEPGVIISRVEAGERAAVAGVKPFELITSVNDQDVFNIADFQAAIAGGGQLRIGVMRLNQGRQVRIVVPESDG